MSPQPKPEPAPPPFSPAEEPNKPEEPHTRHQPEPDKKVRGPGSSPKGGSSEKTIFNEDEVAK